MARESGPRVSQGKDVGSFYSPFLPITPQLLEPCHEYCALVKNGPHILGGFGTATWSWRTGVLTIARPAR